MRFEDTIWYRIVTYGLEYLGRYYGSYRAFVVNNDDPLKMGRVQLLIPHLNPHQPDETWAFPKSLWGGKNYGIQMLPQVADMVWVEFEYGNADYPIYSHAGYAEDELPEEFVTKRHYGFKTPHGTLLLINDNKDEEEILVRLNNQKEWVKINKEELEVEAKLIKLGTNGDEQGVLGNTLHKKMDKIMDKLDETYSFLITHKHAGGTQPISPDDVKKLIELKDEMKDIGKEFPEFLSEKVKIDK